MAAACDCLGRSLRSALGTCVLCIATACRLIKALHECESGMFVCNGRIPAELLLRLHAHAQAKPRLHFRCCVSNDVELHRRRQAGGDWQHVNRDGSVTGLFNLGQDPAAHAHHMW